MNDLYKKTSSVETSNEFDDGVTLLDVVNFFREGWKQIVIFSTVCGSLGGVYAWTTPPKYQATAHIQPAKVANVEVEPINVLAEKLKMPNYYSAATFKACDIETSLAPGDILTMELAPKINKNAPLVTITYRAKSIEVARNCLESVVSDIRSNQNKIAKPILESKKIELANLEQQLVSNEQTLKTMTSKKISFDFPDSKFSAVVLLLNTIHNKENEIQSLRAQLNGLKIALSEPQTKETYLSTPIHAPNARVESKSTLIALISALVGFISAVAYLLVKKSWLKST